MERKITALIVDDETHARENLKMLIQEFCPTVYIEETVSSAREGIRCVEQLDPDLVFLDIMMPVKDGFGFLDHFNERSFEVIFTTAHNEHALKAIKKGAVDYLEKPINIDDLTQAVSRAEEKVRLKDKAVQQPEIKETTSPNKKVDRVSISTKEGVTFVNAKDIVHIESEDRGTRVHLADGREIKSSRHIKSYEDRLNKEMFFRLHRGHLINMLYHLKQFRREYGGRVELSNGRELPVARRKLALFMQRLHQ